MRLENFTSLVKMPVKLQISLMKIKKMICLAIMEIFINSERFRCWLILIWRLFMIYELLMTLFDAWWAWCLMSLKLDDVWRCWRCLKPWIMLNDLVWCLISLVMLYDDAWWAWCSMMMLKELDARWWCLMSLMLAM